MPPRRLAKRARHETRDRSGAGAGDLSRRGAASRGADPRQQRHRLAARYVRREHSGLCRATGRASAGRSWRRSYRSGEPWHLPVSADIDWQRLAGITGLATHVIFVNRSGANDSHLFGDNVSPVQEIFGAGGDVAVHLVSAYVEETMFSNRLDIAAGWMNVENDFASLPLYCNYMNNALCGDPKALPGGDIGHSAFRDAVWAGRVRVRPTSDT
jgi:carbohydrate-selective porin OprB